MKKIHNIFIKIFLLLALAIGWGGSAWAQGLASYDWQDSDFESRGTYDFNQAVMFMTQEFTPTTSGNLVVNFKWDGGNKGLDVYGVDLVDNTGAVVARDYRAQFTGGSRNTISYTLSGLTSGTTYTMRAFTAINADTNNDWINGSNTCSGIISYSGEAATGLSLKTAWNLANERALWSIYANAPSGVLSLIRSKGRKSFSNVSSLDTEIANLEKGKTVAVSIQSTTGSLTINGVELLDGSSNVVASDIHNSSNNGIYVLTVPATGTFTLRILAQSISSGARGTVSNPTNIKFSNAPQNGNWAPNTAWHKIQNVRASKQNNSDGYMSTADDHKDSNGNLKLRVAGVPENNDANALWCIVPSGTGSFYFYNKATGANQVMGTINNAGNAETRTKMYEGVGGETNVTKLYTLGESGDGFWICLTGTNKHLDDNGNGYIGVWNDDTNPKTNEGNRFIFTEVELTADVDCTFDPADGSTVTDLTTVTLTADQTMMYSGIINDTNPLIPVVKPLLRKAGSSDIEAVSVVNNIGSFTFTFPTPIPNGSYTLVIPEGTFYINDGDFIPVSEMTANYTIASGAWKVIITGAKRADERITYHNNKRFKTQEPSMLASGESATVGDGEYFIFKDGITEGDLLDCDFTSSAASRTNGTSFVYGPVFDWDNKTITCEIREAITAKPTTAGWYQLKWDVSTNNSNPAQRYSDARETDSQKFTRNTRDANRFYITMPRGGNSGRNEYLNYNTYPTDDTTPLTFVKLVPSGNNLMMMTIDGRFVKQDGTPLTSGSGYANPVAFVDGELDFQYWFPFGNNSTYFLGQAGNTHNYFYTAPAKFEDDRYEFYEVRIKADNVPSTAYARYKGSATNYSMTNVYQNGYFVFPKGHIPTVADFDVSGVTFTNMTIDIKGTGNVKTLTFRELTATLDGTTNLKFVDGEGHDLTDAKVKYVPAAGDAVELTSSQPTHEFNGVELGTCEFRSAGDYHLVSYAYDDESMTLTFTLGVPEWFFVKSNYDSNSGYLSSDYKDGSGYYQRNTNTKPTNYAGIWRKESVVGNGYNLINAKYLYSQILTTTGGSEAHYMQLDPVSSLRSGAYYELTDEPQSNGQTFLKYINESNMYFGISGNYWVRREMPTDRSSYLAITRAEVMGKSVTVRVLDDDGNAYTSGVVFQTQCEDSTIPQGELPLTDGTTVDFHNMPFLPSLFTLSPNDPYKYLVATFDQDSQTLTLTVKEVGSIIHRPSLFAILANQKAAAGVYTNQGGRNISPDKDKYYVKGGDGTTWVQNTPLSKITHYVKPGETRFCVLPWAQTTDGSNDNWVITGSYQRWYNYDTEGAPNLEYAQFKFSNNGNPDQGFMVAEDVARICYYKNGIVVGNGKAHNGENVNGGTNINGLFTHANYKFVVPTDFATQYPKGYRLACDMATENDHIYPYTPKSDYSNISFPYYKSDLFANKASDFEDKNNGTTLNDVEGQILEPTLTLRYVAEFLPGNIIADEIIAKTTANEYLEEETIVLPTMVYTKAGNVLPLGYTIRDYCVWKDGIKNGQLVNITDDGVTFAVTIENVQGMAAGSVTVPSSCSYGNNGNGVGSFRYNRFMNGSNGIFYTNQDNGYHNQHYVELIYPNNRCITLAPGAEEATCDVLVKLQAGSKTYLIKKFKLHFKSNHEPRYFRDLYAKDELQFRTDESIEAFYGAPKTLNFVYRDASSDPANELKGAVMSDSHSNRNNTGLPSLYAFPLDPEMMPYGFRSTFNNNADWGQYMLRRWFIGVNNKLASALSTKASYRYQRAKAASAGFSTTKQEALDAQAAAQAALDQAAADRAANPDNPAYDAAWRTAYETKLAADRIVTDNAGKEAQLASDLASAESELKDANAHSYGLYIDSSESPGTIARLNLGTTLCKGARIAATAMITSGGDGTLSTATGNMSEVGSPAGVLFRLLGVKNDGTTVPIYSYYPGQIGHKWKFADNPTTQTANAITLDRNDASLTDYYYADDDSSPTEYQSDCAWQQCYFEFVNNSDEHFVDYVLEIDNACLHSAGGDIWLDDIRLYWKQPVPEVEQAAPVCGSKLDVMRVTIPFDDAVSSGYGVEIKDEPTDAQKVYEFDGQTLHESTAAAVGVVQYCFGYKDKYDAVIDAWREAHPGETETTEVHAEAFWTSLLGDVNETDHSSPHFPFHQVAFSAYFNDHKPFAFNDVVTADGAMKMAGRYTSNNGVRQLVFNAKVTDDDLAADDFYIFCRVTHLAKGTDYTNDSKLAELLNDGFSNIAATLGDASKKNTMAQQFGAGNECGAKSTFYVAPPISIVIDGSDTSDPYNVNICDGASPQISIEANKYTELGGTAADVRRVFDWYLGTQKDLADPALHSVTPSAVHDAAWLKAYIESQRKEDGVTPMYATISDEKLAELLGQTSLEKIIKAFHCCTGYNRPFPLDADGCTYFGLTSDTPLLGQAIQGELTNGAEVDYIYTLEMNELLRRLTDDVADTDIDERGILFVSGSDVSVFSSPVLFSYLYALQLDMSKAPEEGVNICAHPVGPEIVTVRDSEDHVHYTVYCDEPQEISFRPNPIVPETTIGHAETVYPSKLSATPIRITQSQVARLQDHGTGCHLIFPLRGIKPSGFFQSKDDTPVVPSQHRVSLLDKFKKQLNDRFKQAQEKKQKRDEYRAKSADTKFQLSEERVDLVVTSSNDPRWETFVTLNGTEEYLPIVGTLTDLSGSYSHEGVDTSAEASITFFSEEEAQASELNGLGRYFQPREGYYYVLRANFKETAPADSYQLPQGIPEGSQACLGTLIIPLKIVPEYMEWTGAENDDWSNERNWRRADHTMLRPDAAMPHQEDYAAYPYNKPDGDRTYNGLPVLANEDLGAESPTHYEKVDDEYTGHILSEEVSRDPYIPMDKAAVDASETFGYAPVADTRIIIRRDATRMPRLYAPTKENGVLTNVSPMANNGLDAEYENNDTQLGQAAVADTNGEKAGTIYIQYDMVTVPIDNSNDLTVAPYYTNTVKQVHIEDGAQILGQEFLKTTDGVSLDIKVDNESWYTMASPLAGTVAGDMYIQAKGSKPTAPLFKPIGFEDKVGDNYLYDRWRPAVYQRSWDKNGKAVIVRLDNDECDVTDARYNTQYDKTFAHWSRVYNQVEENYATRGFSVKVSLNAQLNGTLSSRPLNWSKDTTSDLPDGYVADSDYGTSIFRLPKADTSYTYYQQNGSDSKSDEKKMDSYSTAIAGRTEIADGTTGKSGDNLLYSSNRSSMAIETQNQLPGKIFLVQNPFVCGLDVAKFFEANGGLVTKFWGIEGGEAYTATKVEGEWVGSPYNDAAIIPPYRSFFVEVNGAASQSLTVNYTSAMEALATLTSANQSDNNPQQPGDAPSRRRIAANNDSNLPMLTLMSCNAGGKSRAHVYVSDEAHSGFVKNEDAEVLFQSDLAQAPTIFTLADDMGTAINVTPKFYRLPLCITSEAAEGTTTTVTFTGVDAFSSALGSTVVLYDSVADCTFDLEEGTTLELPAQTVGRYFLQTGLEELAPAQDADLDGRVYNLHGIRVASPQHGTVTISRSRKAYNK